nr:MAG: RNA-dependent RNA polymerase [Wenzhou shrew picorna-like virus 1]
MENCGYANILKRSEVESRLVEDLSAFGLTVSKVITHVSGVQQINEGLRHLPVTENHQCPGVAQGERSEVSLLPGSTETTHPGVENHGGAEVNLPGRCKRGSVCEYDGECPMSQIENFLLSSKTKKELQTCKLQSVCTLRQHNPMELCVHGLWHEFQYVEIEEQLYHPHNPIPNNCSKIPDVNSPMFAFMMPEFWQEPASCGRPGEIFETFCYPRQTFLDAPWLDYDQFLHTPEANHRDIFERHFYPTARGVLRVPSRIEAFNMLRDMFQRPILSTGEGALCLTLCATGRRHSEYRFTLQETELCKRCGGSQPFYEHGDYHLPIIKHCVCSPNRPVVVSPDVPLAMLLNYSDAFQRLSYFEKTNVLRMLGGSKDDILMCGQLGPLRVRQLGDHAGTHEQLFFIFMMNGLQPFVFSQKTFSEFLVVVHDLSYRYLCQPWKIASKACLYELIATAFRLHSFLSVGRAFQKYSDDERPLERTVIQILGKQELDHGAVLTMRMKYPERIGKEEEVAEMGPLGRAPETTWRKDPWMKIAEIDADVSTMVDEFVVHSKVWNWFEKYLRQIKPELGVTTIGFRRAMVHLFAHYLSCEESSVTFTLAKMMFKAEMTKSEVWAYNAMHALLFLGYELVCLWKDATREFQEEKMESGLVLKPFFDLFMPIGGRDMMKNMIEDLRLYSLLRTFTIDLFGAIQAILWWIVSFFKKNVMGVKDEFETFMSDVDSLQEVYYLEDGSTTSLRHQLVKDGRLRDRVMSMMTLGTQLKRRLEKSKASKDLLKQVNDRVVKLNKIVSGSAATFVGAEGKLKPFTVFLYGEPGSGKSVMLPHLFSDLCYALGAQPFDKSRDMYVLTAKNGYHDQYAYQRFVIRNDVLQMRDDQVRTNEIDDLINMADETPYPLDIAQCEGKGQVYFTSPYLFMTSNFDIRTRTPELASYMTEPDALVRRMDMIVEVHKVDYKDAQGFVRQKMRFTIQNHRGAAEEYVNWYGLVDRMVEMIAKQYDMSFAVNTDQLSDHDRAQLDVIRGRHLGNPLEVDGHPEEDPLPRYVARYSLGERNRGQFKEKKVRFSEIELKTPASCSSEMIQTDMEREKRLSQKQNVPKGFTMHGSIHEYEFTELELHGDGKCDPRVCEYCNLSPKFSDDFGDFSDALEESDGMQDEDEGIREESENEETQVGPMEVLNAPAQLLTNVSEKVTNLVDRTADWAQLPEPSWWERKVVRYRSWLPDSLTNPVCQHVAFYDSYAVMMKCGVAAATLLSGWLLYKGAMKLFFNKEVLQSLGGNMQTSGGEAEFPRNKPQKRAQRNKPFRRREFEQAGISEMTGWAAPNGRLVETAVFKNLCVVCRGDYRVNGLFVHDHILMIPYHIFKNVDADVISVVLHGGVTIEICMTELEDEEVFIAEKNHIVFLNIKRWTRLYPQWSSLVRYFVDGTKENLLSAEWGQMFTFRASTLSSVGVLQRLMIENVGPASGVFRLKGEDGVTHPVEKSVRGRVNTVFGDCGGPWVLDHETGARIVGIHVSSEKTTLTGRATLVTKQMIRQVMDYFACRQLPIVEQAEEEAAEKGVFDLAEDEWYDCEDTMICDMIGHTNTFVHNPSRTTLAQSVWRGITPVTKVPSRLKEFTDKEGKRVRPTKVRFQKWIGPISRIPVGRIRAVYPYLSQWYPRPPKQKRRVLTIEEAVFGEEDGINGSIEQNTSVGWPWKLSNRKRSEFFNIEQRTMTDEFRDAVAAYLEGQNFDTVVLDTLKDERVKQEKYEKGDTRVFTICDFTLNTALKMLFGDFVHYLQARCHECPVKIGISPLPSDWTKLYDALVANGGGLIAGDMSGWDHRCHFEVMMGVVDWINEWYDDEYKEIRYELARMSFEPIHLCDGNVYRSRGGMPSGSYLTTPINSLGVLTYIYMFAQSIVGEDLGVDNRLWLVPAVYGDDHVVAVAKHPSINQQSFCAWFKKLGIIYTDESKNAPTRPYTNIDEVAFLKRSFRKHDGYVWGPLPEENLLEQVQWYRRSATQRKKSQQQLSEEILDTVLNEFFFHGREVYNKRKKQLLEYAMQNARLDVSNGAPSYEHKWEQFMGDGKPPPITRISLIPE